MDKKSILEDFVGNRPEAIGAYGYGSGVFRQSGYSEDDNPQLDLIFLVDNLKDWHRENIRTNKSDYSFGGRIYSQFSDPDILKGNNRITYYSPISENGYRFKYGVMEEDDFLSFLRGWENFFIPGRFQKPVLEIKGTPKQKEAIEQNKRQAFLVASLLAPDVLSKTEFYKILCNLSYYGTPRMYVAENPRKVDNIVNGSYSFFNGLYDFNEDYIEELGADMIKINHIKALHHVKELPVHLLKYLYGNGYDITNIFSLRSGINTYLREHNTLEEICQTLNGIKTNGIARSTPYLLAKVKKRFNGK